MNLPRFTAEASLYEAASHPQAPIGLRSGHNMIYPQIDYEVTCVFECRSNLVADKNICYLAFQGTEREICYARAYNEYISCYGGCRYTTR